MSDKPLDLNKVLENAKVRLAFGDTVFGIFDHSLGEAVGGYRSTSKETPDVLFAMYFFIPQLVSECREKKEALTLLEKMLTEDIAKGKEPEIDAMLIDVNTAFLAFAEGLIVGNTLEPVEIKLKDKNFFKRILEMIGLSKPKSVTLYYGRTLLLGRVWKLYVQETSGVLGTGYAAASVDRKLHILE